MPSPSLSQAFNNAWTLDEHASASVMQVQAHQRVTSLREL
jgi:hypothetical protein